MQSRLPELLAEHLGTTADRPGVLAIAADVRDEIGEVTHLREADPDALADIVRQHGRRVSALALPEAGTAPCPQCCDLPGGGCALRCMLPAGHDGGRHRCKAHFTVGL